MGMYESMAKSHPKLERGRVWCRSCGRSVKVDSANCLCKGRYTMNKTTRDMLTEDEQAVLRRLLDRGGTIDDAQKAIAIIDRLCAERAKQDAHQKRIAAILGIDAQDTDKVERAVKELHDDPTRFAKLLPQTCECDHLCRRWNPSTGRCESCGYKYRKDQP